MTFGRLSGVSRQFFGQHFDDSKSGTDLGRVLDGSRQLLGGSLGGCGQLLGGFWVPLGRLWAAPGGL